MGYLQIKIRIHQIILLMRNTVHTINISILIIIKETGVIRTPDILNIITTIYNIVPILSQAICIICIEK